MTLVDRSLQELWVCHLGTVPYRDALAIQEQIRGRRQAGGAARHAAAARAPARLHARAALRRRRPAVRRGLLPRQRASTSIDTDRGGQVTYHGPGQLVGYPIMRIDDVHRYLRTMEDAIIAALAEAGVQARSRHAEGIDYTGVWVVERKIASIGVHVSRGVTTHGFAVNVDNDLEPFSWVVACGLPDVAMTSLAQSSPAAARRPVPARPRPRSPAQRRPMRLRVGRCSPARASASPCLRSSARPAPAARLAGASRHRHCERRQASGASLHKHDPSHLRRAGARMSATRSRSNPGGMDVLERARPRRAAAARAQAAVVQGAAAGRASATAS